MGKMEGENLTHDWRQQRHWTCNSQAVCKRGRVRLHHGAPSRIWPPRPSIILRCPMLLITNTLRPDATELSLPSSDQVMETQTRQRPVKGTSTAQVASHDVPLLCDVRAAPSLCDISALFV